MSTGRWRAGREWLAGVAAAALLLAGWGGGTARACVGARPLAMGGAFIAVADDVEATYWNPAVLAFLEEPQGTGMITASGDVNYRWYFAYGQPMGGRAGVAASTLRSEYGFAVLTSDRTELWLIEDSDTWYWVSLGVRLSPRLAVGANLRTMGTNRTETKYEGELWGNIFYYYAYTQQQVSGQGTGGDLSLLYRYNDRLSFGLLIQDALETTIYFSNSLFPAPYNSKTFITNVRPGVAYRVSPRTTVAFDIYGLNLGSPFPYYSLGVETWLSPELALRGGYYHDTFTFGGGLRLNGDLFLDYAYIYESHLFSLRARF